MKKLFKTTVSIDIFLTAEDSQEAGKIAWANLMNDFEEYSKTLSTEVKKQEDISVDWKGAVPFSNPPQETRTCETILAEIVAASPKIVEIDRAPQLPPSGPRVHRERPEPQLETITKKSITPLKPKPKPKPKLEPKSEPKKNTPNLPSVPKVRF